MEGHRISFSKQAQLNTSQTHPKRENPNINNCKRVPLADKQLAQQFMRSYINVNHLLSATLCFDYQENINKKQSFPLANHLNGYYQANRAFQVTAKNKVEAFHQKDHQNDTITKTQLTYIDEESQFQSYLKQYETLLKNSRSKEFISPMAHNKEMDELIIEFLSDMQDSNINSSEVSSKNAKIPGNHKIVRQKIQENLRNNGTSEIVKVQKIDLSQIKANSYHNPYKKSDKKESIKQQKQNSKLKQRQTVSKQRQDYVKFQQITVQSKDYKSDRKKKVDGVQNGVVKDRRKSQDKLKLEVINVQDLRKKKAGEEDRQLKHAKNMEFMGSGQRAHQSTQSLKNSYLKQNFHKISKNDYKNLNKQRSKIQNSQTIIKKEAQNIVGKKPLQIEIQISQFSSDEEQVSKPTPELEQQTIQIIKMVSKKVTSLLQNTQKIALNKAK